MKRLAEPGKRCSLSSVNLDKYPALSPECLFVLELEQDKYFPFLAANEVLLIVQQAMQKGFMTANRWGGGKSLKEMVNILLKEGLTIRFEDKNAGTPSIRADYDRKQRLISIYRQSVFQIRQLFQEMNFFVPEEDLFLLHLVHEWFHHLEETRAGRTDVALPRVTVKQKGPFSIRKPIKRLREIAAHTFTQASLNLAWSPVMLDYLLLYKDKGWSISQIREIFKKEKERIQSTYYPGQIDRDNSDV